MGELNPVGDASINEVSITSEPYLQESKQKIGDTINCYQNPEKLNGPALYKFMDNSFRDTYRNMLCSNVSINRNITIGSDVIFSFQSLYIESILKFDICKITDKCNDPVALNFLQTSLDCLYHYKICFLINKLGMDKKRPIFHQFISV